MLNLKKYQSQNYSQTKNYSANNFRLVNCRKNVNENKNHSKVTILERKNIISKIYKTGVIITTHGYNGVYVRQAIEAFIENTPKNTFIVVYINESRDPITLNLKKSFPSVIFHYIQNQKEKGGLTGTWNMGIKECIKHGCDTVVISNDDVVFDNSIMHIINECQQDDDTIPKYYGPLTNNPGPNNSLQYSIESIKKPSYKCILNNKYHNLNGFLWYFH